MAGLLTSPPLSIGEAMAAELRRWARSDFDLAADNCGLAVLGYVEAVTGRSVPRGRGISGARAAVRLTADRNAFVRVASGLMARLGWERTEAPAPGDVGLVDCSGQLIAAVCVIMSAGAPVWAMRGGHGVVMQRADVVLAWRR